MINYSVSQMVNPQDQEEVKYYAHAQAVRNLDINDFAKHIAAHGCVYSRADIAAVLTMAVDCIREQLLEGNKVNLGELGAFSIALRSKGTEKADDFTANRIYAVNVNWTPGKNFKDLLEVAEFRKVPTRKAQAAVLAAETAGQSKVELKKDASTENQG